MKDRRSFLLAAGAVLVGACTTETEPDAASPSTGSQTTAAAAAAAAADAETAATEAPVSTVEPLTPAMFDDLPVCALTASAPAGPFPTAAPLNRREIHEGYPGHPLRVGIRVVNEQCRPISGATVDIWHTDAGGDYSEYEDGGTGKDEGSGSTFCRGAQTSDDNGILEFLTIYPGWYPGRTVHIHASVRIEGEIATTQLYLDESLTQSVHSTGEYAQFGAQDTSWAADPLVGRPADDGSLLVASAANTLLGDGTLALINLGVDLS